MVDNGQHSTVDLLSVFLYVSVMQKEDADGEVEMDWSSEASVKACLAFVMHAIYAKLNIWRQ